MVRKIITWLDLQGRYRVTSPAYDDEMRPNDESEDETIERIWAKLVASGGYGIPSDHPRFHVEDSHQRERLVECCGTYFRYVGRADENGRRTAIGGAWEMDVDGRPKVNMVKARDVHMDNIRVARNEQLSVLNALQGQAIGRADNSERVRIELEKQTLRDLPTTFDLDRFATPKELMEAWPSELPPRS